MNEEKSKKHYHIILTESEIRKAFFLCSFTKKTSVQKMLRFLLEEKYIQALAATFPLELAERAKKESHDNTSEKTS